MVLCSTAGTRSRVTVKLGTYIKAGVASWSYSDVSSNQLANIMKVLSAALFFFASLAAATPLSVEPVRRQSGSSACAQIAEGYKTYIKSTDDLPLRMSGPLVLDCLQSMPLNQNLAAQFINETLKYVQWQSTLEALKGPPDSYLSNATDILGGFEVIRANASAGKYASQHDFDTAMYQLIATAKDGHFSMIFCSLGIFPFRRQQANLVSISSNGVSDPEIYEYDDAPLIGDKGSDVSPMRSINGQPVFEYLSGVAATVRSQDPDAVFNGLFVSNALASQNDPSGAGAFAYNDAQWPGQANTTIEYVNGSTQVIETTAVFNGKSFNISSGEDLFNYFCLPTPSSSEGPVSSSTATSSSEPTFLPTYTAGPVNYPKPYVRDPYNQISGYNLQQTDLNDTAVMFIPSFSAEDVPNNQSSIFADVATRIVNRAVGHNKTRLVIDVSGNGGGNIVRAFDLFKLFFPGRYPYSATRFRNHESIDIMGKVFSKLNYTDADSVGTLAYTGQVTPDQMSDLASQDALFDGGEELGVQVSSLVANFNYTLKSDEVSPIRGFGEIANTFSARPFEPENIVIVGDGYCASTCTTFVNLMTNVGGVKTVVFGGRPNGNASMQIMGGVRGGQFASFGLIDEWILDAASVLQNDSSIITPEELQRLNETAPIGMDYMPLIVNGGGVNFRNAYQEGSPHLPLQFSYQAADCRRYFTKENIIEPATVWATAARLVWGDADCVGGKGNAQGTSTHGARGGSSGSDTASGSAASSSQTGGVLRMGARCRTVFAGAVAVSMLFL